MDDALRKGASVLAGGGRVPALGPNFYAPTLLGDATRWGEALTLTLTLTLTPTLTLHPPLTLNPNPNP